MSTDTNEDVGAISSPLDMSDDEIAGMSFEALMEKYGNTADDSSDDGSEEESGDVEQEELDDVEVESEPDSEEDNSTEEESDNNEDDSDIEEKEEGIVDNTDKDDQTKKYEELKSITDRLFAPFKANGKELKVDDVEQAISLMQMGANYTQKMTQIKPQLKTLQMLEQHGLTDPEQLSYLIDLHKKDPKAIAKLIKDAELSPHQLGDEEADAYVSSDYTVSDTQFDFATVTKELRSANQQKYTELMNHVAGFDTKSKNEIFQNPEYLKDLNEHVIDGTFDKVMAEVDRKRMLGDKTISSLPVLHAYVMVGRAMAEEASKVTAKAPVVARKAVTPKPKDNPAKATASAVKSSGNAKAPEVDFLNMSDEEFAAFDKSSKLLR